MTSIGDSLGEGEGAQEERGRTGEELHRPYQGSGGQRSGRGDQISERLDGWYVNGESPPQRVRGWFYPDPRGEAALPPLDT